MIYNDIIVDGKSRKIYIFLIKKYFNALDTEHASSKPFYYLY